MSKQKHKMEQAINRVKKQFPDSETVFTKAYDAMRQKTNDRCACDVPMAIWHARIPGEFKYRCLRCRMVISPLSVTPLGRQHKDLTHIIELACRFYYRKGVLTPSEISKLYNCQYRTAVRQAKRVTNWMCLTEEQSGLLIKEPDTVNQNRVCKSFAIRYPNVNAALDGLFSSLPSLIEAMKQRKSNNNIN